ncbi:7734_t:CDS:2 [Dentiscutata erythropus]|uniref:7734_t:CDS:1 n=1 Tax=Dentiscutata erythropus TaxID=1348616 RepID=A0A9N9J1L3_9GLOM|nr:7734_t:CDS:2 [Dentiscutata erythropus]
MTEESNLYSNSSSQADTYSEEDILINSEQGQLINRKHKSVVLELWTSW